MKWKGDTLAEFLIYVRTEGQNIQDRYNSKFAFLCFD